ncbi:leucine-rich repeat domain-containing protein, partial [Anaerostipes caccae]|uniref:leucine-rich repeat protein n=1 Tax=Anaerostipes caccae TaxID=105841 RepID=UPI001D08A2F6
SIDGILTDKDKTTIIFAPAKADAIAGEYRIPAGITAIGNGAFLDCNGLTKLTIPNTVTTIGELAFYDCDDVEEVIFEGTG